MRKKGNIVFGFIVLILFMGLGYAYLNSDLNINGITNISSANWNVYWNNVNVATGSVTDVTTAAHILTGETEVEFNVNFTKPGDFYEFTVKAINGGTIDAMIGDLTQGVYAANGITPKTLPDYLGYIVTYSDGITMVEKHLLEAGKSETYKIRVYYKDDIVASQLPSTDDNYVFKFGINYEQADETAIEKTSSRYVYRYNSNYIYVGDPESALGTTFTSYQNGKISNVRHKIINSIVVESAVVFRNSYSGPIDVVLVGADDGISYNKNKQYLINFFTSDCCTESESRICCSTPSGFRGCAYKSGSVNFGDASWGCGIYSTGHSACSSTQY